MLLFVLLIAGVLLNPASCSATPTAPAAKDSAGSSLLQAAGTTAQSVDTSLPMVQPQASVTLDQVVDVLSELCQGKAGAATGEPLATLAKTLADIQKRVAAMSGRLDLIHDSQIQQQKVQADLARRLDTTDESISAVQASQEGLSSRVDELIHQLRAATAAVQSADLQTQLDAIQIAVSRISKAVLGRRCHSDADCSTMLPEAVCGGDGQCSCQDGYKPVSNTECRRYSRLSEACQEDVECQTWILNSTCASGVCECAEGFWKHNNAECRLALAVQMGDSCVGDEDCASDLDLRCVTGTCSCPTTTLGNYEYRLTGGPSCSEGSVQLRRYGGSWGLVCDDGWDSDNARVVCRSLNFTEGSPTLQSKYGNGTNFHLDNVSCFGFEPHLIACIHREWDMHNCGAGEVAGVQCS